MMNVRIQRQKEVRNKGVRQGQKGREDIRSKVKGNGTIKGGKKGRKGLSSCLLLDLG